MNAGELAAQALARMDSEEQVLQGYRDALEPVVGPIHLERDLHTGICYAQPPNTLFVGQGESFVAAMKDLSERIQGHNKIRASKQFMAISKVLATAAKEPDLPPLIRRYLEAELRRAEKEVLAISSWDVDPTPYPSPV